MSATDTQQLYEQYQEATQKAADLYNAAAVLGWDQEVYMPAKGYAYRGRQLSTLASQAHDMVTNKAYGELLYKLKEAGGLGEEHRNNIRLSLEDYEKNSKLPAAFVEELTRQTSASFNAWIKARQENDFSIYLPELKKMVELTRKKAELFGYTEHPYDALLDEYEKGATVKMLDAVFNDVKEKLPPLLERIRNAQQVDNSFFRQHYPRQQQWDFSMDVLKAMGYDFEAGRQDISEHPFTTSFAPTDVRVTTRVDEENYESLLWSSIHEGGHALYEQGLPELQYGMPLGQAASLSIHESQSRLWENNVGRSLNFWKHFYPKLQQAFPEQLTSVSVNDFYKGINQVAPSLIRTEADEVTYHFHVLIRYEIEKSLIAGDIAVEDLSKVWNEYYQKYLGVRATDEKQGVLQDVHWAHGSFGYFPTYSLGSFYAAQIFQQAQHDISGLDEQITNGEFGKLLQWLREHVHRHGRAYRSEELCSNITGRGLDFSAFMQYITDKYTGIYGL